MVRVNNTAGVYKIECKDRFYIGQSNRVEVRWQEHIGKLKKNEHSNKYLQNLYNKHGIAEFKFSILDIEEDKRIRNELEICWVEMSKAVHQDRCINHTKGGTGGLTWEWTDERKKEFADRLSKTYHLFKNGKPITITNVAEYCRENGLYRQTMYGLIHGNCSRPQKIYKGHTMTLEAWENRRYKDRVYD